MQLNKEKQFKILVIDDNSKNIQLLGNILRENGYSVGFAFEGKQALTLLKDNTDYDLILLDVNMPVLNGFETCKILRKSEKLKDIPVIFLTALNDTKDIITGFDAGGQDYITKPFNTRELLSRVKTQLELKHSKDLLANANLHLEKKVLERTEELNKAKLKAEESDKLKTSFLALINHEIRTPLNAISGFSTIIAEENKNKNLLEFSEIINSQTELLVKLVDNIIDSAQIESGNIKISKETFDLNIVINELLILFKPKCTAEVVLTSHTPFEELLIDADRLRIKQIFSNLILNAIKFTNKGTINFGYTINNNELICFVKDTGIGIEAENHKKIFNRFLKLDSFTQGTGLGLNFVKNLLELMNGQVWIESELDKGAAFYFKIPLQIIKNSTIKTSTIKNDSINNETITILIAEDEVSNFIFLNELLNKKGTTIIHANNGKEAVEYCNTNKNIDIVLMDINMPIINGLEATKQIKKLNPQLPIIAQSAYTLPEDISKTIDAGCNGFLSKPINKNELFSFLKKFLNHKSYQ